MQTTRHDGHGPADRNRARYEAYDFPPSLRRAALTVATLASFLGPFMGSSVNVALPTIGQDLDLDAVALGWINMAFLLTAASFAIPFGRLADIYGRLKIYTTGITVFTLSSVLIALATSGPLLIAGPRGAGHRGVHDLRHRHGHPGGGPSRRTSAVACWASPWLPSI